MIVVPPRRVSGTLRASAGILILGSIALSGCQKEKENKAAEAPQTLPVDKATPGEVHVDNPGRFALVTASPRDIVSRLDVTGAVSPDVSRELPVLSLANGRVVALKVGLGDTVRKGQLVMQVQSPDVSTAFATYLKAVSDEHLAKITLDRDKLLYDKGAIPQTQLEGAQNGEEDATSALTASEQQLRILGVDKDHPGDTVNVYAPTNGVVVTQSTTAAGAAGISYAGNTGSLTIADLSHVWVICDVYENDLASVHLGQHVDIHLNAFPGQTFDGTISDIGATLDASLRTAKVRIQVPNPAGKLRLGMFATATILGSTAKSAAALPGNSILHLHDTTFVFAPASAPGDFRRIPVRTGQTLSGGQVQIESGITPGQQVVANALDLQNTADNQ